ncbi:S8 family serine peptidase [Amycolatopsis saalfeldensis]|uniref:Subtilase family protein n=1 Tax=Amycolatopsis saalfeldensis TaxID=394193 RepID=A0A1H8YM82_9PSEU|nr:S8 family serine peptidase [Amycolatopsis saalfeldensis]SEP53256.1 Subtilase family protein [Amycolatopsis saalfeldensis]
MQTNPLRGLLAVVTAAVTIAAVTAAPATAAPPPEPQAPPSRHIAMPDGGAITLDADGTATRADARGKQLAKTVLALPQGTSALGGFQLSDDAVRATFAQTTAPAQPGDLLVQLADTTAVTGVPLSAGRRAAKTSDDGVNAAFGKIGATSVEPVFPDATDVPALAKTVLVHLGGQDPAAAAKTLAATPGVVSAKPNRRVSAMSTGPVPVPQPVVNTAKAAKLPQAHQNPPAPVPSNYGVTSSAQSYLNAGGTNALGAYSLLPGKLPGAGEIITNVSIGDLTDQSMADAGDGYVSTYGPTTVVQNGQRYLDLPSMPLIPTYTASPSGRLDPLGSAEQQDPALGEVLLDFGVMAPLPHDKQRPGATGSGLTDLLGIAPGAQYRLVVPQQPTTDQIAVALMAAARQTPRPDVITASLGFGTDTAGFPGRYLEDDPVTQAVIATIVRQYHIVVTVSSNDGTRLYTPAAVGPDGGSTPTDVTRDARATTDINDDATSTTPSQVTDSGAIAVGGTTLDDTLAVPQRAGGAAAHNPTFATTRTDGGGNFSSGFGTRVDVSAPSDGILVYEHTPRGSAHDVTPVLNGGTSASAPMTAAAAAVVLQAAKSTGRPMDPAAVRSVLERTARPVASPPQADRPVTVGPQIDVTAAVQSVLGAWRAPAISRVSVAHRVTTGGLGGQFLENADGGRIDLATGGTGEGLLGPVTVGADVVGAPPNASYALKVGGHEFTANVPAVRLTPAEILTAAGLPVVSTEDRSVPVTFEVRLGPWVVTSAKQTLVFGPTDGAYAEAQAPVAPATVAPGQPVKVHYDLTGVRNLSNPQLVVSTLGHWNPVSAPLFGTGFVAPLTATAGDVLVPATAFASGAGVYGIGIVQRSVTGSAGSPTYGEFTAVRVGGTGERRPDAPTLAAGGSAMAHSVEITRAAPGFSLGYDVRGIPGATGAAVEFSAPAPTLFNALNTVTNANGDRRDQGGQSAGSVAYQQLPSRNGVAGLDAVKLGLGGSLSYNVRVFATDRNGRVLGQASPTSFLTLDDGYAPGDTVVTSFAAAPQGTSYAALREPGAGESVREYNAAAGTYGRVVTSDPSPDSGYQVLGADADRLALLHFTATGAALETYDTATAKAVGTAATDGYTVQGGRVDPARHRAAILAKRTSDNADVVLPLNLGDGKLGTPLPADPPGAPAGGFKMIELDQATGLVYLSRASTGLICFGGGAMAVAGVDLDSGAVRPSDAGSICAGGLAVDEGANKLYQLTYRSVSLNIVGTTSLNAVTGDTLAAAGTIPVRQQQGGFLAVDSGHHLGLVAFRTPPVLTPFGHPGGVNTDNNATSQFAVMDLVTGKQVSTASGLNFVSSPFGGEYDSLTERSAQFDPATRTGWVPSSDGRQLQQFRY